MPNYIIRQNLNEQGIVNGSLNANWALTSSLGIAKTGSVKYLVVGENRNTSEESIRSTPGIPFIGQQINGFWCQEVDARWRSPHKHRDTGVQTHLWEVVCSFDSEFDLDRASRDPDGTLNATGQIRSPIFLPAKFSIYNETVVSPFNGTDADGKRIVNTLGQPFTFDFEPEVEEEISIIQIERWGPWPTPISQLSFYNNTTNENAFHGLPARTALMRVRSRKQFYEGVAYAREQYSIKVKIDRENPQMEGTFGDLTTLNRGSYWRPAPNAANFVDRDTRGRRGVFPLKADGTLAEDENDLHFLTFKAKRSVDWGPLNLPNQ